MSTDVLKELPRWALILFSIIGVLLIGAVGTWAGSQITEGAEVNQVQDKDIRELMIRVQMLESSNVRIEVKLDRILERLGERP